MLTLWVLTLWVLTLWVLTLWVLTLWAEHRAKRHQLVHEPVPLGTWAARAWLTRVRTSGDSRA